jgi:hypothetical protein
MNTSRSIVVHLQEMAQKPGVIDANTWLTGAMKLRVLLQEEQEKLVDMEREVQLLKASYLSSGDSAAAAKIKTETSDLFVATKKQEVFIKTALDLVLLAKKYATTEVDIYKAH